MHLKLRNLSLSLSLLIDANAKTVPNNFDVVLDKFSVYEVKVSASTKAGEGQNTAALEFRTDEDSELDYITVYNIHASFFPL